jgi:oligosaccharide repeat unit polymerase
MFVFVNKILAILISILILAQAYYIRKVIGTYVFPACLLCLAWFFYTIIPLTILFDVPVNPLSILFIFNCVSAFSLSALFFNWPQAFKANKLKNDNDVSKFDSKLIHYLFYISSACSIVCSTISVITNGFDLNSLIFNLMETSGQYAAMRGAGNLEYNLWGVLSIFFTYATPILGGLIYQQQQKSIKKWTVMFIAFIPSLYYMVSQSAKLIVFYSIGFYYASVLLKKIYMNKLDLFNRSLVLKMIGYSLLLLPLVSISFLSRQGFSKFESTKDLVNIISYSGNSYALGELYAFSDFFSNYLGVNSQLTYIHDYNSYGYYTFTSIMNVLIGNKYFPPGTYEDGYYYKELFATNIYTIFRGLIYDFGSIGTICFMFVSGLVAHAFFYRLLKSRSSWVACSVFIITIIFIQGTYLASIFMARFIYLLLVVFVCIFWINNKYCKNNNVRNRKLSEARKHKYKKRKQLYPVAVYLGKSCSSLDQEP